MHAEPAALRTGATVLDDAGRNAHDGAQRLELAGVTTKIFGDFDDAHGFHTALVDAKDGHRDRLHAHHQNLTGVAHNVRTAADGFSRMDQHNAALLRDVTGGSA